MEAIANQQESRIKLSRELMLRLAAAAKAKAHSKESPPDVDASTRLSSALPRREDEVDKTLSTITKRKQNGKVERKMGTHVVAQVLSPAALMAVAPVVARRAPRQCRLSSAPAAPTSVRNQQRQRQRQPLPHRPRPGESADSFLVAPTGARRQPTAAATARKRRGHSERRLGPSGELACYKPSERSPTSPAPRPTDAFTCGESTPVRTHQIRGQMWADACGRGGGPSEQSCATNERGERQKSRSKVVKSQLESSWRRPFADVDNRTESGGGGTAVAVDRQAEESSILRPPPATEGKQIGAKKSWQQEDGSGRSVILASGRIGFDGARRRLARASLKLARRHRPALKCDSLIGLGRRWAHLALALALALLLPLTSGSGLNSKPAGQSEGDELSRAVLATMSTQAPPPPIAYSNASTLAPGDWATDTPPPSLTQVTGAAQQADWLESLLEVGRIFVMSAIIVGDICGNSLVILSVCRHSKLRVTTNWFVVSLACADILVALFAMTFNASVIVSGRWLFKPWVCDFWNSCDVLASTASILHLCCISIDRYIAIMRPLDYPMKITTRRVVYALCAVWISSALLSYIPIFTGVYTTAEHIQWLRENPDQCEFVVNRVYAIVSSSISFWIPCCIMVFTYYRIYREATRQEKFIYKAQAMMPAPQNHHHHHGAHHPAKGKQRRSKSVAVASTSSEARLKQLAKQQQHQLQLPPSEHQQQIATTNLNSAASIPAISAGQQQQAAAALLPLEQAPLGAMHQPAPLREPDDDEGSNSGQSTPTKRSISKMKREHKAAKTLGIIMGVFILCWLPFFSWYTPMHICGHACDGIVPRGAVTILFWIGYFNSTLNPIIYAYFNHEFRDAFKKTLQWLFCCCQDLKCLRVNRPNDNQHYNCTYRSTQEIGLVSNS